MRIWIFALTLFASLPASASRVVKAGPKVKASQPQEAPLLGETRFSDESAGRIRRPPLLFNIRAGWMLTAADPEVEDKWDHNVFPSYAVSVGLHFAFPRQWREIYFYAGGDFAYLKSEEEIDSEAELTTTIMELAATAGVHWFPPGMGSLGVGAQTSFGLWSQKETELKAQGFSRSLGKDDVEDGNSLLPVSFASALLILYRVEPQLVPFIALEFRTGSALTAGVNYGF
jgi:hypothetical protein